MGNSRCARAARVEHLDGVELGLLGNAVRGGADGARDVGTVAVTVCVAAVGGIV